MSNNVETAQHKTVDNPENISYPNNVTSGNDSNNNAAADEYVPDMGAVTSKPSTESGSSTSGDKSFINRQWDQDYNYIMDMMFLNGAASSHDREIQKAYQYLTNNENRDKKIPDDIMKTFEKFMKDVYDGKNNDDLKVHKAQQYINNAENEGKTSPDTVKAVMAKTTAHDLSTQTMRNDQIRRSQGIALGDADVDYYDYDEIKERNDFNPFHNPTDHYPNIKQSFGEYNSDKGGDHIAIDIGNAGQKDPPIYSIYKGDVVYVHDNGNAGGKGGNGLTVIIRHVIDGKVFFTAYMHLKNYSVKEGDPVYSGEQIGIMGKTGGYINKDGKNGMGVHLHLMVFTCSDVEKFSHNPKGYASNGKSYKGTNGVTYTFYDPWEVIDTRGKILWN